jgi:hypothetical protein
MPAALLGLYIIGLGLLLLGSCRELRGLQPLLPAVLSADAPAALPDMLRLWRDEVDKHGFKLQAGTGLL